MNYLKVEPHPVKALLSEADKAEALRALPVADRRIARLLPFCAECVKPVAIDKLNRFRHVA